MYIQISNVREERCIMRIISIIGTTAMCSLLACFGTALSVSGIAAAKSLSANNADKADHNAVIRKFNEEHGTDYQIATDEQMAAIGADSEERDSFIGNMSEKEFEDYLMSLYDSENKIINAPYVENNDEPATKTVEAKRVDKLGINGEFV